MSLEKKSEKGNSKILSGLIQAEILRENSPKDFLESTNDCYGLCDSCDCICNQPCDHTTPDCYALKSDQYKTE
ncbi:MAG TPA: hypothetical protein VJ895_02975 [Candidatus Nanoarchaeia archaeon]|nr:hypothetical protein [Candidatus Nanoarchaeia archaeon]